MSPRAAALLARGDLAVDEQRPDQGADGGDPGHGEADHRDCISATAPPRVGRTLVRAVRSAHSPRHRRRGRRSLRGRPAPRTSRRRRRPRRPASPRKAPRRPRVAGGARPPGREPDPEHDQHQPQGEEAADRAQLREGLEVQRVGIVEVEVDRALLPPRRTGRCRRRSPSTGCSSKVSTETRQKS